MRAAKVQAGLSIRAVSTEPSLLAHTSSVSRGTFRQKARSLAPLYGWACTVKICHDRMLEDTNLLDGPHLLPSTCRWPLLHGWTETCQDCIFEIHFTKIYYAYCGASTFEPGHEKMCLMSYANNKGADQPSLISAFVVRCLDSIISLDSIAEISGL